MPRRCIISASPELARIAPRRRGLIIHVDMVAKVYVDAYMCTHVYETRGTCLNAYTRVYVYLYAYMYRHVCKYVYV